SVATPTPPSVSSPPRLPAALPIPSPTAHPATHPARHPMRHPMKNSARNSTTCPATDSRRSWSRSAASPTPPPRASREILLGSARSEEHTSELQSREKLVCRLLLEK